jgi:hypothetical protein
MAEFRKPDVGLFVGVISLIAAVFIPILQANGVDVNWQASLILYLVLTAASVWSLLKHALPHRGLLGQIVSACFLVIFMGGLGIFATVKQYHREHRPEVTITWREPSTIDYGTPLSEKQLNAVASVGGTFVYNPTFEATLSSGVQTLSVTFTPKDLAYLPQTKTVTINIKPPAVAPKQPKGNIQEADLIADFVDPEDLDMVISNPTQTAANQPTFQTILVNLEAPSPFILPIGRQTGDFLKGHASLYKIQVLHYGNAIALNGIKPGDRIFGWIALSCADCMTIRYYYVYYEYMKGGWYSEAPTEPSPNKLHTDYVALARRSISFDSYAGPNKRIPIVDRHSPVRFPEQGTLR